MKIFCSPAMVFVLAFYGTAIFTAYLEYQRAHTTFIIATIETFVFAIVLNYLIGW